MRVQKYMILVPVWLAMESAALTYFLDQSCTRFAGKALPAVEEALQEAIQMAKNSITRLSSATDTDFDTVYSRIFTSEKTEVQYANKVSAIMTCLGAIEKLDKDTDPKKSDIRIFCDNDATTDATVLVPDVNSPTGPKVLKRGLWRPRTDGLPGYVDNTNAVVTGDEGLGCAQPSILGVTYGTNSRVAKTQPAKRSRITICDITFNKVSLFSDFGVKDLAKAALPNQEGVQVLANTLTHTVLHELSHITGCNTIDYLIDKTEKAYGWTKATSLAPKKAVRNADNYAFLGMFAGLADLGWSLPRKDVDTDWDDLGQRGIIKYRKDVTKRWIDNLFSTHEYCGLDEVIGTGKQCVGFEG